MIPDSQSPKPLNPMVKTCKQILKKRKVPNGNVKASACRLYGSERNTLIGLLTADLGAYTLNFLNPTPYSPL